MKLKLTILLGLSVVAISAQDFLNLGFESATVPSTPADGFGDFVRSSDAYPGWIASSGTEQLSFALYNNTTIGETYIDIFGPHWDSSKGIIDGLFTAVLQAGSAQNGFQPASLSQVGTIPSDIHSILFRASGKDFAVTIGGTDIPLFALAQGANYTQYAGDISAFAGSTAELRFSALSLETDRYHNVYLDRIEFSTQVVPEPSMVGMLALGGMAVVATKNKFKSKAAA